MKLSYIIFYLINLLWLAIFIITYICTTPSFWYSYQLCYNRLVLLFGSISFWNFAIFTNLCVIYVFYIFLNT